MKHILPKLGVYKRDTFLCIGLTTLEVIMEILLPFITAKLLAEGLEAGHMPAVYRYGAILVVMSLLSLIFGATAGRFAASASTGMAANLREAIYNNIQTFFKAFKRETGVTPGNYKKELFNLHKFTQGEQ